MTRGNDPINYIPELDNRPLDWYGLTKREYFAAMAMQGILTDPSINDTYAADYAVKAADALIKKLNDEQEFRPIKELLELMLKNANRITDGFYSLIEELRKHDMINDSERLKLINYVEQNLPFDFYKNSNDIKESRINWLKEQIKKLENENN